MNFTTALRNLEIVLNLEGADGLKENPHQWNKLFHQRQGKAYNCGDLEAPNIQQQISKRSMTQMITSMILHI